MTIAKNIMKIKNIGIVVIFFIIIMMLELGLRISFPVKYADITSSYEYSETLGYKFKSNIFNVESTDHYKEDITNSIGLVNIEENFLDFSNIVYTIGDSYTKGTGLMFDSSYPFYLSLFLNNENKLSTHFEKNYGVLNLGTPGYGLKQSKIRMDEIKNKSKIPDIVCYLGSENDYHDDLLFQSGYKHKHLVHRSPYWDKWYMKPFLIVSKTQIMSRIKILISWIRQEKILEKTKNKNHISNSQKMLADFSNLIKSNNKNNIKTILSWSDPSSNSYNWLKNYCRENKIPFADWNKIAQDYKSKFSTLNEKNAHSGGHKRSWINYMIALAFFNEIQNFEVS